MAGIILALVLQFVPFPPLTVPNTVIFPTGAPPIVRTCTSTGLHLSTKVMTSQEAFVEAEKWWGKTNVYQWTQGTSTVYLAGRIQTPFGWLEPSKANCVSPYCFKNTNGSWRSLWNSIVVDSCKRMQAK